MNMSMDEPIAQNRTEGTWGPQVKNDKMKSEKRSPGLGNGPWSSTLISVLQAPFKKEVTQKHLFLGPQIYAFM